MTSALFSPLTFRSITTRNRVWVSPMCQYSCENHDGVVERLAPRSPGILRSRRCGPRHGRGHGRVARGPHQPLGHRHLERRTARRLGKGDEIHQGPRRGPRDPAPTRGPQGLHLPRLSQARGAFRSTTAAGTLSGPPRSPSRATTRPSPSTSRASPTSSPPSAGPRASRSTRASRSSRSTARTAISSTSSCRQ